MIAIVLWFNSWAKVGVVESEGKTFRIRSKKSLKADDVVRVVEQGEEGYVTTKEEFEFVDSYSERFSLSLRNKSTR